MSINYQTPPPLDQPSWLELNRIAPLQEASRLSGLSPDSLRRHHADRIVATGPKEIRHACDRCPDDSTNSMGAT